MQEPNLFAIYTDVLLENQIDYFVTGAVASIIYGDPRLTHDIDLIISLNEFDVDKFISAFSLDKFYCPPKEVIINEIKRSTRGHFNLIHHETGFKADVYLIGDEKSMTITDFLSGKQEVWEPGKTRKGSGHGGGDHGLAKDFIQAISQQDASLLTSTIDASMESHLIGFKAEESRVNGGKVLEANLNG